MAVETLEQVALQNLQDKATRLRIDSVRSTTEARSGHPTSCASAAEIMSVLFYSLTRYDSRKSIHLINRKLNWARAWLGRSSLNSKRLRNFIAEAR